VLVLTREVGVKHIHSFNVSSAGGN